MRSYGPTTLTLMLALGGCAPAVEVAFEPAYLEATVPSYLAETQILVLMEDQDLQYVFEGPPESFVGQSIDLRIPLAAITREITAGVFRSHFNYGVVFAGEMPDDLPYILAIHPEIVDFSYRYDQHLDDTVVEVEQDFLCHCARGADQAGGHSGHDQDFVSHCSPERPAPVSGPAIASS